MTLITKGVNKSISRMWTHRCSAQTFFHGGNTLERPEEVGIVPVAIQERVDQQNNWIDGQYGAAGGHEEDDDDVNVEA